jgi:hypothetical protein
MNKLSRMGVSLMIGGTVFIGSVAVANIISGNVSTNYSSHATYTLLTINEPASVTQGDLLLANIEVNGGTPANITAPAGWTQILRTDNDTDISIISYWKIAGASEPSTYTWTVDTQTRAEGGITQYSGIDPTNPIDVAAGNSGFGKVATTSSIMTSTPNEEVVALYGFDAGNNTIGYFSTPTGMTEKYDVTHIPLGPSTAADDVIQTTAGTSGSMSSTITGNKNRNWVSQAIALRMLQVANITENFESYAVGSAINSQNGGTGWTGPWTGDTNYLTSNTTSTEGANSVTINAPVQFGDPDPIIKRSFSPLTTGTIHWKQRKDNPDDGQNLEVYSGGSEIMAVGIGATNQPQLGGPDWSINGPTSFAILKHYTIGSWDTADLQFDTTTNLYRVSIDGGAYSAWTQFEHPASSVDTIRFELGGSGSNLGPNYWDDIQITGH